MAAHEEKPYAFYVLKDNEYTNLYFKGFRVQGIWNNVLPEWTNDVSKAFTQGLDQIGAIKLRALLLPFCPTLQVVLVNRTFVTYDYKEA